MPTRRPREQIVADIDEKLRYHFKHIARLSELRDKVENPPERKPRARKTSMKAAMDALKEAGLTPDEILALAKKAKKAKAKL